MLRTHTCGELRIDNKDEAIILCGWVQKIRDKGGMVWIDLRDRYGITQLVFEEGKTSSKLLEKVKTVGREFVLQAKGKVVERYAKNDKIPTGDIEIQVEKLEFLNKSKIPPFLIENDTDGGEELRMKYRYLDLRRNKVRDKLIFRHKMLQETRAYLSTQGFIEIETPLLIKSTPEGARDFVVPSRINQGEFYALPQSPQTFKQLLMVAGFDKYFQIVKCFRDEDLRADRQPEFTQIDCEMSFVTQADILKKFEELIRHLFKKMKGVKIGDFVHIKYDDAMRIYGSDKPDIRFGMEFVELNDVVQNKEFSVFNQAELVIGICIKGCAKYTRKQLNALTDFVKKPQIGAKGLVYIKHTMTESFKSSVDKFYSQEDLKILAEKIGSEAGDLILILAGEINQTRKAMSELRLEIGNQLGLRDKNIFKPLWVLDFPLLEWREDSKRFHAMHHPFTSPKTEDIPLLDTNLDTVKANAYDLVINGVEIGGGSIRIHDRDTQATMFKHLGFTDEEVKNQFGFLMDAFEYGTPPHGGIALGFDRLCAMFGGSDSIRDYIAFPKNTSARDVMIESPSAIAKEQLKELGINLH